MTPQEIIDLALEIGLGDPGDHLVPIRNGRSKYDGLLLIDEYCIGDYVIKFAEALGIEVIK